jgi:RHS repeat-associated protein
LNNYRQLDTEIITGLYSKVISKDYETTGMVGRYKNIETEYDVDCGFDQYGRFSSVTNGTDTFTYGYLTNSNLVSTLTVGDISVNNTYETNRNLITSVENKYSATTVSKYDYVNDAIGRRTSMAKSGTAFTQSDTISYGYNDRSEVTSATATNDTTYNYGFAFDNIGNRSTYTTNETGSAVTSAYTSNNLNQYTAITNPTNNPTYDNDGNMLTNGDWTYTWNGENRLIKAEKSDQKLEFTYDYMGRRVEKKVTDKVGTIWTVTKHEYFVYDGYKLIEKLNVLDSNAVTQKFVWSGEKLLSVYDAEQDANYCYTMDANRNISELIDGNGNTVAHYEYSPFGKILRQTGTYADTNPFRFSREYFDTESGLVYYNYRYYSPELGRWTKKDPITSGNRYAMVKNMVTLTVDFLGLQGPVVDWARRQENAEIAAEKASGNNVETETQILQTGKENGVAAASNMQDVNIGIAYFFESNNCCYRYDIVATYGAYMNYVDTFYKKLQTTFIYKVGQSPFTGIGGLGNSAKEFLSNAASGAMDGGKENVGGQHPTSNALIKTIDTASDAMSPVTAAANVFNNIINKLGEYDVSGWQKEQTRTRRDYDNVEVEFHGSSYKNGREVNRAFCGEQGVIYTFEGYMNPAKPMSGWDFSGSEINQNWSDWSDRKRF